MRRANSVASLNLAGGYTRSVQAYSYAAAEVIVPHVLGRDFVELRDVATAWPVLAENTELIVGFGGIPMKNAQVNSGGIGRHVTRGWLAACEERGVEFVNVGPLKGDIDDSLHADWLAIRPNTDTALMLGLAHTLVTEGLHDRAFLDRYSVGFERFSRYVTGDVDGRPKDAAWAAEICGVSASTIVDLREADGCTSNVDHVVMVDPTRRPRRTALLDGYGARRHAGPNRHTGRRDRLWVRGDRRHGKSDPPFSGPTLSQGENKIDRLIPVARISDMLLHPGEHSSTSTAASSRIPTSISSIGPAATPSTTIRISIVWFGPGKGRTRSS